MKSTNNSTKNSRSTNPFQAPLPYPEVGVEESNPHYANILMKDYAGSGSELTAITQYLYHNLTESQNTDMSRTFMGIAKVEMMHLHMLGEIIVLLGGKPVFTSGYPGQFWTGRAVTYSHALSDKLADNLKGEQRAIRQYEQHIAMIDDSYVKAVLKRIILDEEVHMKLLQQAMNRYDPD